MRKTTLALLAIMALIIGGCGSQEETQQQKLPPNIVPKNKTSKQLDNVTKHLDLGGVLYGYMDISDDLEKCTEYLHELAKILVDSGMIPREVMANINVTSMITKLGLNNVDAIGISSFQSGELYHNKFFIGITGERQGLMKAMGGKPSDFEVLKMAPKNSDLVFQQEFNFKAIRDVAQVLLTDALGPAGSQIMKQLESEDVPGMGFNIGQLLDSSDTRIYGVARINDGKTLQIPDTQIFLSKYDIVLAVDNFGWLVDNLGKSLGPMVRYKTTDKQNILEPKEPLPDGFSVYKPALIKDNKTNRLYIVSSTEFLDECLANKSSVKDSDQYKLAMKGLPTTGNSISYVTPKITKELKEVVATSAKEDKDLAALSVFYEAILPDTKVAVGQVSANLPEGILCVANSTNSHKATILSLAYLNPVALGAIAIPAIIDGI